MTDTKELRGLLADAGLVEELQLEENGFWTLRPEGHNQFWGSVNHQPYDRGRAGQFAVLIVAAVNALPDLLDTQDALVKALQEVADPISFMRKRAKESGGVLNGSMAVALSEDANFLKSIARAALAKVGK